MIIQEIKAFKKFNKVVVFFKNKMGNNASCVNCQNCQKSHRAHELNLTVPFPFSLFDLIE